LAVSKESRVRAFYQGFCPAGKAKKVALTALHADAAHHSQYEAEEWNAVEGGGESAGLIFKTVDQACLSY
jgi:hypothetical protein